MRRAGGFTLLELLIGISLLGLILVVLFAGFRLASDSWERVDRQGQALANERLGRALARRVITLLQPLKWSRAIERPLAFFGQADRLRGVAPLSGLTGGLRTIELALEPASGREGPYRLVIRQSPLRYEREKFDLDIGEARSHVVLERLAGAELAYFGADNADEAPRWRDSWAHPGKLPQLVRLRIRSVDGAPWADLVAAPAIGGDRSLAAVAAVGPF